MSAETDGAELWPFPGGLRLPARKEASTSRDLREASLPAQLILPLHQHMGEPAEPVVEAGQQVLRGETLAAGAGDFSVPVHAPTSGTVLGIEDRPVPHPSGLDASCIILEPDGRDRRGEGLEPCAAPEDLSPSQLRERIRDAGIAGLGGAVFPTWIKLHRDPDVGLHALILNGAECEPYISCDDMLMRTSPDRIIAGARIMLRALEAPLCLIAVEEDKPEAIEALRRVLEEVADERLRLVVVPSTYPEGGERQLIQSLTGREVPSDGLPLDIGYVCQNVGTAAAVADAVTEGRPLDSRVVTVTGEGLSSPCNLIARIGTPVSHLIEEAGGYAGRPELLIMGGPMMGFTLTTDAVPVVKATNCILAAAPGEVKTRVDAMPCIRCGDCADVCPASLQPQQLYWYTQARDFDEVQSHQLFDCIECGCCDLVCPSHIPLVEYFRFAKSEIWTEERERRKAELARRRFEFRKLRLEEEERERQARLARRKARRRGGGADPDAQEDDPRKAEIAAALERARRKKEAAERREETHLPPPRDEQDQED